ncbi:uncharacterized protein [Triticum aestivum]|uniref:uncharacterized protein n=1 Tax=Triticum aestivum TaxID=4565 RepID=UPI001D02ACAD|nr:uncharacterized protein LOC123124240 [Triticum aestivum]
MRAGGLRIPLYPLAMHPPTPPMALSPATASLVGGSGGAGGHEPRSPFIASPRGPAPAASPISVVTFTGRVAASVVGGDPVASLGSGHRPMPREASRTLGDFSAAPVQSSSVGGWAGGLTPNRATREEVIAFGGIPDPVSEGRRMSSHLQEQPDVDDMQLRCAMQATKLHDIEVSTGMSVNTSNSILHFSNDEIVHNANQLGVSLGSNGSEITKSVNDILDLEAERALEMIRNIAAVKPMNDSDIDALGVRALDSFCADLAPSLPETEEDEGFGSPKASIHVDISEVNSSEPGLEDRREDQNKPKRKWKRKVYPVSAVHRSARIRTSKKIHDEI